MRKYGWLLFWVMAVCLFYVSPAFAEASANDEIWTKLAGKAAGIGLGLKKSGYIIAGIGLIFFSFMAIFNKISWKNLAYIMLSCFVLTISIAMINWFSQKGNPGTEGYKFVGTGADTSIEVGKGVGGVPGSVAEKNG